MHIAIIYALGQAAWKRKIRQYSSRIIKTMTAATINNWTKKKLFFCHVLYIYKKNLLDEPFYLVGGMRLF